MTALPKKHYHGQHRWLRNEVTMKNIVLCEYSKFRILTSIFDSIRAQLFQIFEYLLSLISYLFNRMTMIFHLSNQQNLLLPTVQVLYLLEVFILAHYYGPPSTGTPTTTIERCHKNSWIYLTSTYLLLVTIETNDNYSIWFEVSNNSSTIRFNSKWKNTVRTALVSFYQSF